ncbi:hypothetical protein [Deinococcus kurensis]|uniref:hypothetical protein n=1 Tax=Deinococcus kurensis TaxID=2662757 RepID=UPI0012D33298|nr:hypothetical protein [Deinococcus kurensis]
MSNRKKSEKKEQAYAALQAVIERHAEAQARWLSMSEVGQLLGLNPHQMVRAKQTGKLPTKRLDVAKLEDVQTFAKQHITTDKNGKLRVTQDK